MTRFFRLALVALCLFAISGSRASACQLCAMAQVWTLWPPLLPMSGIALGWLLVSVVHRWIRLPHFVWWALPLLGLGGFLFFVAMGAGGLPILPYFVLYSLSLLIKRPRTDVVRRDELRIAAGAAMLMLLPVAAQLSHPQAHDDEALIALWPGTAAARVACRQLARARPPDLPKLRRAVSQVSSPYLWQILDVPIIEKGDGQMDQLAVLKRWDGLTSNAYELERWETSGLGEVMARTHGMPKDPKWTPQQWHDWLTSATIPTDAAPPTSPLN